MEHWPLYILAGLAAGIVSSAFGIGGGILMVPILVIGFSVGQKSAQGMSLFILLPMALAGAIRYKMNPDIPMNLPVCALMALGGVAGAMIGSHMVFGTSAELLKRLFAVFVILMGINLLVKSFAKPAVKEPPHTEPKAAGTATIRAAGTSPASTHLSSKEGGQV